MVPRLNIRELVLMSAPIASLLLEVTWFQMRSIKPAPLTIASTTMTSINATRATAEVYSPPGATAPPVIGKLPNTTPRYQRRLDRKVKIILDCNGKRPAWWGQDDLGTGAFLKSTVSQLSWNVNACISFKKKGKEVVYLESDRSIGVMGGTPYYDEALDRYVACFYFASTCVPSPDGRIKFEGYFWPNYASPSAKASVWLKM